MASKEHSAPLHPATVHFPIAFLTLHYALDLIYALATLPATSSLVNGIYNVKPLLSDMAKASYYMNLLGFITAVPAVLSGGQQLMQMIKKQDLANKVAKSDNKAKTVSKTHPKLKIGFAHAALNDLGVAAAGYHWYSLRNEVGFLPSGMHLAMSAVLLPTLFFSAYLGGEMVYKYNVGTNVRKVD